MDPIGSQADRFLTRCRHLVRRLRPRPVQKTGQLAPDEQIGEPAWQNDFQRVP